jgi:hypothetical protein
MRFLLSAALIAAVSALSLPATSSAATLNLTGSLGSSIATGIDGNVTYGGNAAFGDVTFIASPNGSDLTWSSGNGLGIDCPRSVLGCNTDSAYQIDTPEVLTVQFERNLFLTSLDIGLLSPEVRYSIVLQEYGAVVGSNFVIPFSSAGASNGQLTLNVNRWVSAIYFVPMPGELNDFSLARLRIDETRVPPAPGAPIPEPSSVLLMVVGAGIVATQLRSFV